MSKVVEEFAPEPEFQVMRPLKQYATRSTKKNGRGTKERESQTNQRKSRRF